jgi:hypothetical protein
VDTNVLKVDTTNNRVGIGTASPAAILHVASGNVRLSDSAQVEFGGSTNSISGSNASNLIEIYTNNLRRHRIDSNGVATWSNVGGVAGDAMTLNSTGLGVGVSPNDRLTVLADNYLSFQTSTLTFNSGRVGRIGAVSAGSGNGYLVFETYKGGSGGGERLRIDSDGNVIITSPTTPATLATNGQLTVNATSNTNLRFSYRGSDGVTRVANITLA